MKQVDADNVNLARLKLIYEDDFSLDVGRQFCQKQQETVSAMRSFCKDNAIFFSKRMIIQEVANKVRKVNNRPIYFSNIPHLITKRYKKNYRNVVKQKMN